MKDVCQVRRPIEEIFWACGVPNCSVHHESSSTASRCPNRVAQLGYERTEAGRTDQGLLARLLLAQVGGCNCTTKSDNILHHASCCHYRLHTEAHEELSRRKSCGTL